MPPQLKIGIAGGPSSGKTTLARALTNELNLQRYGPVENVVEYARTFINRRIKPEKRNVNIYDQEWLYKGQKRLERDCADAPILVTDCPTFLAYVYSLLVDPLDGLIGQHTRNLIQRGLLYAAMEDLPTYSALIFLPPGIPFKQDATRLQKEAGERQLVSDRIEAFLKFNGVPHMVLHVNALDGRVAEAMRYLQPLLGKEKRSD